MCIINESGSSNFFGRALTKTLDTNEKNVTNSLGMLKAKYLKTNDV